MKHIIELYLENISKIRVEVTCPKLNGRKDMLSVEAHEKIEVENFEDFKVNNT